MQNPVVFCIKEKQLVKQTVIKVYDKKTNSVNIKFTCSICEDFNELNVGVFTQKLIKEKMRNDFYSKKAKKEGVEHIRFAVVYVCKHFLSVTL